jgi:signal transduction histidine kinase
VDVVRQDLQQIFEQAPVILNAFSGPDHVFIAANALFRRVTGKSLDIIGRPVREAQPEHAGTGIYELLDRVYATGEPFEATELPAKVDRHGTGTPEDGYFNFIYQPIRNPAGVVTGVLSIATDVTDLVKARREAERLYEAERRARASAERLQRLAVALSEATTTEDALAAVVREVSAAFEAAGTIATRITPDGLELEILRAADLPDELAEEWRRFPLAAPVPLATVARTGKALYLQSRDDWYERFPALADALETTGHHANAVLPLIAEGRVTGALGIAFAGAREFDADDRALAEAIARQCAIAIERTTLLSLAQRKHAEADEARAGAEQANRAKGEFLAVMSHELRTPLNAIGGYTELMEMGIHGAVTGAQLEALGRIQASQRHLLGLINQVLNYTRIGAGTVQYDLDDVPAAEALYAAEALVIPQVRARGLRYVVDACDHSVRARADREKLQQVLLNLLTNAIKFTEPGGEVRVSCTRVGETASITVTDSGVGIAPEKLASIFEPFVQVDQRLTRPQDGVGLGLAISRELARGMGGDLVVRSAPGKGSAFTLTLPAAPEE